MSMLVFTQPVANALWNWDPLSGKGNAFVACMTLKICHNLGQPPKAAVLVPFSKDSEAFGVLLFGFFQALFAVPPK